MLYGEIRPGGQFRFVNFGHPAPLVFSAKYKRFVEIGKARIAQFLALGLEIPEDHPDRNKYMPVKLRKGPMNSSDIAEIPLMGRGDILFLYTDGVFDGVDDLERREIEAVIASHEQQPAKVICDAILGYALNRDEKLRKTGRIDEIDDKTAFIIRRT
jgi:serine phosphatase RsbU (regulator of sigma subunit)